MEKVRFDKKPKNPLDFLNSINCNKMHVRFCKRIGKESRVWNVSRHSHQFLEILFFIQGKALIEVNDKKIQPAIYDAVVYPPNVEHSENVDMTENQEIICLWLDLGNETSFNESFILSDRTGVLRWLFEQIYEENRISRPDSEEILKTYLDALIHHFMRAMSLGIGTTDEAFEQLITYINHNYNSNITLDQMASIAHVSVSYLNRLFKAKFNCTPLKYLQTVRIKKATQLLKTTNYSVQEVSFLTGYEDPRYFCRVFKYHTGILPSTCRKKKWAYS